MDELVNVIDTLLGLVPEQHRPWVEALMALLYALGGLWAAVRWFVAKKLPAGAEPGWFDAIDTLMQALTASSSRLAQRPLPKDKDKP
jgi:hypothetical protein